MTFAPAPGERTGSEPGERMLRSDREIAWSDGGRSGGQALLQRLQRQPDGGVDLGVAARCRPYPRTTTFRWRGKGARRTRCPPGHALTYPVRHRVSCAPPTRIDLAPRIAVTPQFTSATLAATCSPFNVEDRAY